MNGSVTTIRFSENRVWRGWGRSLFLSGFFILFLFSWRNVSPGKEIDSPSPLQEAVPSTSTVLSCKIPCEIHPWGNFEPGAWRFSRTTVEKETAADGTMQRTVTDNRLTLQEKHAQSITLILESQVTLMGKSVKMEPKRLHQDFLGLSAEKKREYTYLSPTTLTIEGQPVHCTVVRTETQKDSLRKQVTVWYSTCRAPFVFRREVKIQDKETGEWLETSHMRVTSMNMPVVFLGKVLKGYQYVQESRFPKYTSLEKVVASIQVPGGVITKMFQDTELDGKPIQKVTVELLDYGLNATEHQPDMYRGSSVRSHRLALIPPQGENDSAVREQEFSMAFSAKSSSETTAAEGSESTDSPFQRFRNRWRKSQGNWFGDVSSRDSISEESEVPDTDTSAEAALSEADVPCRSPIYNQNYRRNRNGLWSGSRMVVSTESLRFSTTQSSATLEQKLDFTRQNWRRHWRTFWVQAFTTE